MTNCVKVILQSLSNCQISMANGNQFSVYFKLTILVEFITPT